MTLHPLSTLLINITKRRHNFVKVMLKANQNEYNLNKIEYQMCYSLIYNTFLITPTYVFINVKF